MSFFDKLIKIFYRRNRVAVVNEDDQALQQEVELLKTYYGMGVKVMGYSDYKKFFLAVHMADAKKSPINVAFLRDTAPIGELILKKSNPALKTYTYHSTADITNCVSVLR